MYENLRSKKSVRLNNAGSVEEIIDEEDDEAIPRYFAISANSNFRPRTNSQENEGDYCPEEEANSSFVINNSIPKALNNQKRAKSTLRP
jgi:hypothetical protein